MSWLRILLAVASVSAVLACSKEASPPPAPVALDDTATGYYCGMTLTEHPGPKAQIFVNGRDAPLWFSQARDGVVFQRSPEEPAGVRAFYVTAWDREAASGEADYSIWIAAEDAYFVIESRLRGGMGADEAVPFSSSEIAARYAAKAGGRVVRLSDIPDAYIAAPYSPAPNAPEEVDDHASH